MAVLLHVPLGMLLAQESLMRLPLRVTLPPVVQQYCLPQAMMEDHCMALACC